ncbi:cytochrome P450 [Dactylonectria macrodidyma]|uniref:Cytochrome P450 n=1 Tax=Dactylonectria macrodidyma TaxID=307937 RepID=A0A9P9DZK2_9HYPO|nr:cytochrome P450 [Dactylonectria macrodidyma]
MAFFHDLAQDASARPTFVIAWTGITLLASHFIYRFCRHRQSYNGKRGPPHSFVLGHLKVLGEVASTMPPNMHPQAIYTEIARKYNLDGIFYLDLWPVADPQVVLTDPNLLDQVSIFKPLPIHPMAEDFMARIIGPNVIATANGALWKKLHNSISPAFSWSNIRGLTATIVEECTLFRRALDEYAKTGQVFSMEDSSARLIFDVIARTVFDFRLYAQSKGSPYLDDFKDLIKLAESNTDFSLAFNPVAQTKLWFKRRRINARLDASILSQIQERIEHLIAEGKVPSRTSWNSILDLMLREHIQNHQKETPGIASSPLDTIETKILVTNVKAMLLGGHGTTTDTLCYIYLLLSKSPEVVDKLIQEHQTVFGLEFDATVEMLQNAPELLQELPYTEAVIKETLRLFPVGFGVREAAHGAILEYQGNVFPIDNQAIVLNGHDLHYNANFFHDPTKFLPERWIDSDNTIPRSYFRTFGRGPRACLGMNLAQNELKIILLMTIRDYDFVYADQIPNATARTSFTNLDTLFGDVVFQELAMEAKPRGGMMMKVQKR